MFIKGKIKRRPRVDMNGWIDIRKMISPESHKALTDFKNAGIDENGAFNNLDEALDYLIRSRLLQNVVSTNDVLSDGKLTIRKHQPLKAEV